MMVVYVSVFRRTLATSYNPFPVLSPHIAVPTQNEQADNSPWVKQVKEYNRTIEPAFHHTYVSVPTTMNYER